MNEGAGQLIKMYIIALLLTLIAEWIGLIKWQIGILTILLVPFFHTIYFGVAIGPKFLGRYIKVMDLKDSEFAATLIVPAVYALMARYGTLVGPNVPKILKAGIALILQEVENNWGSIAIALPIAVVLGLRREVIGACYSVGREPNLGLIGDIYGLDTPEGRGAMGAYITGTVLGAAFFSIIGSIFVATAPGFFHPLSLEMAMGIGSASMMTAGAATLAMGLPKWKDEIPGLCGSQQPDHRSYGPLRLLARGPAFRQLGLPVGEPSPGGEGRHCSQRGRQRSIQAENRHRPDHGTCAPDRSPYVVGELGWL